MSEETQDSGMSGVKKTIIGIVTTAVTAAGAYVTTHIEQIFGGGEEKEKTEQVEQKQESQNQQGAPAPIVVNIENTNQQKQSSGGGKVVERVVEKPAPAKKEEVEDEDPW
ncbi:MAG: hypothetical protein ACO3F3_09370 [Gemmataceae bacterium]